MDPQRYLGIDWGHVRIGLAIGDNETSLASPLGVAKDLDEIINIIKKEQIDIIILGEPQQIANREFPISKQFQDFTNELRAKTGLPIHLLDERLSSKAADALVGDKKTKASRDAIAAMIILQNYLDLQSKTARS